MLHHSKKIVLNQQVTNLFPEIEWMSPIQSDRFTSSFNRDNGTRERVVRSPWLDPRHGNVFRREMTLASEDADFPGFQPDPTYVWLHKNGAEQHLYKALARLAPLFAVCSYRGEVSSWVSPPPSGGGNRICLVVGKDAKRNIRIVGGNYFHNLDSPRRPHTRGPEFFRAYDAGDERAKQGLVRQATANWYAVLPFADGLGLDLCCEWANAMPIYITVLDDSTGKSLVAYGPALVDGLRPADFSYEYFGEVMA